MTIEQLLELNETVPTLPYEFRRFAFRDGLRILFELDDESDDFYAADEVLFYGDIYQIANKISEDDAIRLFGLGWGIIEDSFCIGC